MRCCGRAGQLWVAERPGGREGREGSVQAVWWLGRLAYSLLANIAGRDARRW